MAKLPKPIEKATLYESLPHFARTRASSEKQSATIPPRSYDVGQEIAREQKIKNDDAEQDIRLKRQTLNRLFWFLAIETGLIFVFAFGQATYLPAKFHLEDWSFKLLVSATLAQITGMLYVAVRYLFPKRG